MVEHISRKDKNDRKECRASDIWTKCNKFCKQQRVNCGYFTKF